MTEAKELHRRNGRGVLIDGRRRAPESAKMSRIILDSTQTLDLAIRWIHLTTLPLLLAITTSACYQYYPVHDVEPLPGDRAEVKIQLASPVSLEAGSQTLHQVSTVEGGVYRSHGDTLAIYSRWLRTSFGYRQPMDGAVFYFDRSQFRSIEERRFVPIKTAVAVAAAGGGIFALFYLATELGGGSGSNSDDGGGGGGLQIQVPLPTGIIFPR